MKIRISILILSLGCTITCFAQTKIEKSIPVKAGQKLSLDFDYPDLRLQTWDKNEVLIKGSVSINQGENDNAFELTVSDAGGQVSVSSILKDKENIPQRITIKKDDQLYYFKAKDFDDPEIQKFLEENGRNYQYMSHGMLREIELEIYVPRNMETVVQVKYGLVEVKGFEAPLKIDAKFGQVDATINTTITGELTARTRHGEILTNLAIKFDQNEFDPKKRGDHWTEISARPGKGPRYSFESKFGNVYLRKPE